jgi:hypothetical protein
MHWMDRLLEAFFSFRYARNWRCRFPEHGGSHYQDVVATGGGTEAEWLLHGHAIARLSRLEGGRLLLELRDAGYPTLTTVSRLNAILWKLRELYPAPEMEFRLKYTGLFGHPDHTFFLVDGKAYNLNLLPDKAVRILIDPREGRAVPLLPAGAEYLYFMWHPELEPLRRLYRDASRLLDGSWERLEEVESFLSGAGGFEEMRSKYWELRSRWENARKALRELEARCHLSTLGVAAGADLGALRRGLERLRAELKEVDGAAARLQAVVRLLS